MHPADTELFHHKVLTETLAAEDDNMLRIEDEEADDLEVDDKLLFIEEPTDDMVSEELKIDLPPNYSEEIVAYDKGLNPILEKELDLYLKQYQVGSYIKDYVNPLEEK